MPNMPFIFLMFDDDEDDETQEDVPVEKMVTPNDPTLPGMAVLTASTPEDIDGWPSLASLFNMEDSAGQAK